MIKSTNVTTIRLSELRSHLVMCLQTAASSNARYLKTKKSEDQSLIHLNFSDIEKGEKKPLLLEYGNQY